MRALIPSVRLYYKDPKRVLSITHDTHTVHIAVLLRKNDVSIFLSVHFPSVHSPTSVSR